ncbi:MAG: MFS transporter [Chloroflexi bacterium]|nr:MFS transporter [Chloroflexota bacterium]
MRKEQGKNLSKRAILVMITMATFLSGFTGSSINVALPAIGREFSMDAVLLGWTVTVYPLTSAVLLIPFGRLADIYGRSRIFTYGIMTYTASSFLSAMSISGTMLILLRILQGVGAAMLFTTVISILTSVFPAGERGRVLGINTASVYSGLSMGPFLGGLLTAHIGWRSIFWMSVVMGVAVILLRFWKMKGEWAEAKGARFDIAGSIIYSLSLGALIIGLSLLPSSQGVWIVAAGILGGLAFIRLESRVSSPVLNLNLFKNNPGFAFSNLAALLNYAATYAITFLLSLYLQYTRGFSPDRTGLILVSMPAMQAIFAPLAGRLSDRIEPRLLASTGMALTTAGLGMLIVLGQDTSIGYILASLAISGLGFGFFTPPNTNSVMSSVERNYYGVAAATLATMRQVGFTFSMAIAMLILSIHIGRVEITPEYYGSVLVSARVAFIVFTILCFAGIFASLARGKVKRGEAQAH